MSVFLALQRAVRPAAFAVMLVAFGPAAHAQPKQPSAAEIQTAKQLMAIIHTTSVFQSLIPGVVEQAKILFLRQNPDLAKDLDDVANNIRKEMEPRMGEITDHVALLYAQQFTEPELKQIVAFYRTPVGKKLVEQQPKVMFASMQFAQTWANNLSDEVVAKFRAEMKKKGHNM